MQFRCRAHCLTKAAASIVLPSFMRGYPAGCVAVGDGDVRVSEVQRRNSAVLGEIRSCWAYKAIRAQDQGGEHIAAIHTGEFTCTSED